MRKRTRILSIVVATVAIAGLAVGYVLWLGAGDSPVRARAERNGAAQLTLQTVGALGPRYDHRDWVSYLAQAPDGDWAHRTNLEVPAHSLVRVTIYQYDSATGLRNNYFAQVQGTSGDQMQVDGRSTAAIDPDDAAHTFAVPELGVYVPLPGVSSTAANTCSAAPCPPAAAHRTITFTFRTKGKGRYRWQCFVPCGAGYVTGNGGPMQSFGYMGGFLTVA